MLISIYSKIIKFNQYDLDKNHLIFGRSEQMSYFWVGANGNSPMVNMVQRLNVDERGRIAIRPYGFHGLMAG